VSRRLAAGALVAILLLGVVYWFFLRTKTTEPRVFVPRPVATIGSGSEAIGVTASGALVRWLPLPEDPSLPPLPLEEPPQGRRLRGPALEQVRVLGAAPPALRRFLAGSRYGEDGVEVELTTGIELRFGDASQAQRKWRAAAAVLADPSVTALDYVDLQAPSRPAIYGSEHELPAAP
jgi:cell division septal protein FtsQ